MAGGSGRGELAAEPVIFDAAQALVRRWLSRLVIPHSGKPAPGCDADVLGIPEDTAGLFLQFPGGEDWTRAIKRGYHPAGFFLRAKLS